MHMRYRIIVAGFVLAVVLGFPSLWALWIQDGVPVCTAARDQSFPQLTSDGAGGIIVAWSDERNSEGITDIYAQRVSGSGVVQWAVDGVAVCTAPGDQGGWWKHQIVPDGAGGTIIAWEDARSGEDNIDIYAQRINADGVAQWTANGVAICTADSYQIQPQLIPYGSGGAIITWWDRRYDTGDIYAQLVDGAGNIQWDPDGVGICMSSFSSGFPEIVSDGFGGAIITYTHRSGIYAQRIDSNGNEQWTPDGVAICTATEAQERPQLIPDGSGGAIITWYDQRDGYEDADIYAQWIDATGMVQWTTDGVPVCTSAGRQRNPQIITDGAGGAIIVWHESINEDADANIYIQRIDLYGSVQWPMNGVPICTNPEYQCWPELTSDSSGGAIISWEERYSQSRGIYVQRINTDGDIQWKADGVAIFEAGAGHAKIISDGSDGAFITWYGFDGGECDVYATRIKDMVTVEVLTPNGGEEINGGEEYEITWLVYEAAPDSVDIFLSLDSGASFDCPIVTGLAGVNSYMWNVPNTNVTTARIRVSAYLDGFYCGSDSSDGDFSITGSHYRYVSPSGGNIHPYLVPQWAAHSIQDAVDAADPGDTVVVAASTYVETVEILGPVYLMGGWDSAFTTWDPETYVTEIDATGIPFSVVSFMNVSCGFCGLEGFSLNGGFGRDAPLPENGIYGGGVFGYQADIYVKGNTITNCGTAGESDLSGGGGICCYDCVAFIEDNEISDCLAQRGGGIYLYLSNAMLNNNRISGSEPSAQYLGLKAGGGIYAIHSSIDLEGNVINENSGYSNGGGVYTRFTPVSFQGDTISSNGCINLGGGIFSEYSNLSISHAVIKGNNAGSSGGGIYHRAESMDIANTMIALNAAGVIGGGIHADSSWGGMVNNTIDRNLALYFGGNVFFSPMLPVDVRNNLITYGFKDGFYASTPDNIIFEYNNCYGNFPVDVYTIALDCTNISRNPHYADTTALDYHLLVHSGGIDTGDPDIGGDPDGSRADQGSFGGPCAVIAAPEYVKNLTVETVNDTTIQLAWDPFYEMSLSYFAVYGGTVNGFAPDESLLVGTAPANEFNFIHSPAQGCWYYRVSAVDSSGYGGGYSNQAGECPVVTVLSPNGGEIFGTDDTLDIRWIAIDNQHIDSVNIYCSDDGGDSFMLIAGGELNDSLYSWVNPTMVSDSCLIKILAYDPGLFNGEDTSDSLFSIKESTDVEGDGDTDLPHFTNALRQNHPNPFNPSTTVIFSIGEAGGVSLKIFDASGRLVRVLVDRRLDAGRYEREWDGRDDRGRMVASGIYFYRLESSVYAETKKMVLIR